VSASPSQPLDHLEHRGQFVRCHARTVPVVRERAAGTNELPQWIPEDVPAIVFGIRFKV